MLETLATLPGLLATHPVHRRRLTAIRDRIYRTVAGLDASVIRSTEPIEFDSLDDASFAPIRPGARFAGPLQSAWLRIRGTVPAGLTNPVVMLGIRGEGMVRSRDGELLDAITTVWTQGDLPHSGGKFRPVRGVDLTPGGLELYADLAYNGLLIYSVGRGVFHGAHIAERNVDVFALYYDYLTLVVLAESTADPHLKRTIRSALAAAYAAFAAGDVRAARVLLGRHLAQPSTSDFVYTAVGHGHLDMAWVWPIRETKRKAARTYLRALNSIDERPGYVYGTSQPQQMAWMKEGHPELFARLQRAAAERRIELQGSFWVEPDTNMPSGESLIRQAVVGRRFLADNFALRDEDMRLCWLPDTFGYSGNLPQILRGCGMDWLQTIKLSWNRVNAFPHRTFHWEGIDGSCVLVHMPPEGDYNSRAAPDGLLRGIARYPERDLGTALLVYGAGDGGGGPGEVHHEVLAREESLRGLPKVRMGTASQFFRALERQRVAPRHVGELYLETHQGTYTTIAATKRANRLCERKLHEEEALAAICGTDVRADLEPAWRDVLLNQFHDILPGSAIERVNAEASATYADVTAALDSLTERLTRVLAPAGGPPSAINLTSFPRREHVRVDGRWLRADVPPYAAAALGPAEPSPAVRYTPETIANDVLTVRFGAGGEIVSCTDASGAERVAGGFNRLCLYEDPFQFPFDAWDIDPSYPSRPPEVLRAHAARTYVDGPLVVREQEYRAARVAIVQRVSLAAGSPVIRFDTRVRWHEKHRMLRAEFYPANYGPEALSEIQFGHIARPTTQRDSVERAQFETCAHKWIATEDAAGGFALLNDSKYGHRAKDGLISLNLLRAPTFPDKTADRGSHDFSYAALPFARGDLGAVIREAYRLNNPLLVAGGVAFDSVVTVSDPGVVVETIKEAEGGSGLVVRLYESLGRAARVRLSTRLPHARAVATDLIERPAGPADLADLTFRPFEIKTILLERA